MVGRIGFILANIASAVGLGSIWKFPYEVGANGGSAFVLFYLLGIALIVLPLMLAELALGRRGRSDAIRSILKVASSSHASARWGLVGALGVVAGFLILSFYSVIGGWTIAYVVDTVQIGLPAGEPQAAQARFDALLASPLELTIYHFVFMAVTTAIVARGIQGGIEEAAKILMPALVILIAALAIYAAVAGDLAGTLRFLFTFDPAQFKPKVALEALGLGFFSIGVGLCVMITYAAYAGPQIDLRQVASSRSSAIRRSRSWPALPSFRWCLPRTSDHPADRGSCSPPRRLRLRGCRSEPSPRRRSSDY